MEKYFGRWRNGTMSAKMTWPMVMMPPPPIPWMERPMKKTVKFFAMGAHSAVPMVKNRTEVRSSSLRPKMSDSAAMKGWLTAHARRYDVPAQKASLADPPRSIASVFHGVSGLVGWLGKKRRVTHW